MTPEQEIARYKQGWAEYWDRLMNNPEFSRAVRENDAVRVGEIGTAQLNGNFDSRIAAARGWPRAKFKPKSN
jgi:hypothetical protein